MNMQFSQYRQTVFISQLIIGIIGVGLVAAPTILPIKLGILDVSAALANIGLFLITIIIVQWSLDEKSRHALVEYAISKALSINNTILNGIKDIKSDSRTMDVKCVMNSEHQVTVGFNYSTSLFDRIEPFIIDRCQKMRKTELCLIKPDGKFIDYVLSSDDKKDYALTSINKIKNDLQKLQKLYPNTITIKYHDAAIKYGFISSKDATCVILYSNDTDTSCVPAIIIEKSQIDVHSVIRSDIEGFISKCHSI